MSDLTGFPPPARPAPTAVPPTPLAPPNPNQRVGAVAQTAPTVVDTSSGKADGLNKCPRCGSTDIATQPGTGKLRCNYCRFVFEPPKAADSPKAETLEGETVGSGAADITQPENTQVTIKCQGCGAEVVVDANESMTARCHWCRQILSIEHQIPNGAVPDILLPFLLSKEQARAHIEDFVRKRTFFANGTFKREFTTANITGVYLPYLVVDANAHSNLKGQAGHVARRYQRGSKDHKRTYYDIDIYDVGRDFDLAVNGLTVEASSEKRNVDIWSNTNNVINAIMPFDVEKAIPYNGNYLKGFTSERRDTNIDELKGLVDTQIRDIARFQANDSTQSYDAGIRWESEETSLRGTQWRAAYLPVWLYSYLEVKGGGKRLLHYVAVNARTGETMGSVPVDVKRLFAVAAVIELIAAPIGILIMLMS
ncbi:MAG: TFIIB-type zinc ribbon-containing protein [Coriobacteriales bacterium]|jgi:ribosomal protein S27E|nr:TFIIB-type zinc ribbon-containing protein [Coriobacteriales bacterium]